MVKPHRLPIAMWYSYGVSPSAWRQQKQAKERSRYSMKSLFILFIAVHLLVDLAMPSLPGAFRFNPDESVVGIRVQSVQAQDLRPAVGMDLLWKSFELPRVAMTTPVDPQRKTNTPDLFVFLPRRDPSPDPSLQQRAEDD